MEDPEENRNVKDKLMTSLRIENIVTYSVVLLLASYMIVKYLIIEKKYDIAYLTAYYALTVALALSKITFFIVLLRYTGEHVYQDFIADISNSFGPQFKVQIGLIQVAIMLELGIQVKLSARLMTLEEVDQKINHVRVALKVAIAFFSAVGIFDTYNGF